MSGIFSVTAGREEEISRAISVFAHFWLAEPRLLEVFAFPRIQF
ncbi:MAG: hypothetical protein Q4C96_09075 [Planctomycetia bacterium]|nr:hypothetical protein [Planctomycetia bacterium]